MSKQEESPLDLWGMPSNSVLPPPPYSLTVFLATEAFSSFNIPSGPAPEEVLEFTAERGEREIKAV